VSRSSALRTRGEGALGVEEQPESSRGAGHGGGCFRGRTGQEDHEDAEGAEAAQEGEGPQETGSL